MTKGTSCFEALGLQDGVHIRCPTDANFDHTRDPASILKSQEKEKKRKYLAALVTPFIVSTGGMLGCKASTFAKCLSAKIVAEKRKKPYSQVCGYVHV
jgi:hypothetical protein